MNTPRANTPPAGLPTHLPASAYRLGMRVQYTVAGVPPLYGVVTGICKDKLHLDVSGFPYLATPAQCKPVVYRVDNLSYEQAQAVYDAAFGERVAIVEAVLMDGFIRIRPPKDSLRGYIDFRNGKFYAGTLGCFNGASFDIGTTVDALERLHIDYWGWLAQGLAVDATTL